MEDKKQMSEQFIKFIINKEKFDFNAFKTREEYDNYQEELNKFLKENKSVNE